MATAYSYIRCSTPEQLKGDTLRRQSKDTQDWADRNGHTLDNTLRDLGRSAFSGANAKFGALREFLALVEKGEIERGSYLVVESLDRLSRESVLDALPRLLDLIAAGIKVVTLVDGQEYSDERLRNDSSPLIMSLLIMMRAHEESRTKSIRVGKAWSQKRLRAETDGQAMTAICPGWIRLVGGPKTGHYELIEERAIIVRSIFEDAIDGRGRRATAKRLNELRVPTWGVGKKRGSHWHDSYIQKILNNPAAFGRYEPGTKRAAGSVAAPPIGNYFPAVIDEATFYKAMAASRSRGSGGGRTSVGHRNLFRGLAKCGSCGGNLTILDKGKRSSGPKLICSAANINAGCKDRRTHSYVRFERAVLWTVGNGLKELVASSDSSAGALRLKREAEAQKRQEIESRLNNLIELVAAGGGGARVVEHVNSLELQLADVDKTISNLDMEIGSSEAARSEDRAAGFLELIAQLRQTSTGPQHDTRAKLSQRLRNMISRIDTYDNSAIVIFSNGSRGNVQWIGPRP